MKNIVLAGFLFFTLCNYAVAQKVTSTSNNRLITWESSDDAGKTKLTVKGEVQISDDDKHMAWISKNGSVSYQKKSDRLEITAGSNGELQYRINKIEKTALDARDEALLASAVQMMIVRGINAEARTKRIYAQKGSSGVLNEIPKLHGDYARQKYLSCLLTLGISSTEMTKILESSGQYLTSDYYNAELLSDVMKTYLDEASTSRAYLEIVRDMKSDYYQYTTLQKLMKSGLNGEQTAAVVAIIKTMKSDYYQSEVYKDLLKQKAFDATAFNETLESVFAMNSDYYKTEIIKNLIKRDLTEADWTRLITYANRIESDYYQSELLLNIADKMPKNDELKKNISEAAKSLKSEYYYGKLMRKIATS